MSSSIEYEGTIAGRDNAAVAQRALDGIKVEADIPAAQVHATLAIYEVLADIASELAYMRRLSQGAR